MAINPPTLSRHVLVQLQAEGSSDPVGPPLSLPLDTTHDQLQTILRSVLPKTEDQDREQDGAVAYSLVTADEREIVTSLAADLFPNSNAPEAGVFERTWTIYYRPQAAF